MKARNQGQILITLSMRDITRKPRLMSYDVGIWGTKLKPGQKRRCLNSA